MAFWRKHKDLYVFWMEICMFFWPVRPQGRTLGLRPPTRGTGTGAEVVWVFLPCSEKQRNGE